MNLGFVGLGQMGRHMAMNLHKNNATIMVFDAKPEAVQICKDKGLKTAETLKELAVWSDIIFLSLPNAEVIEKVVFNEEGIAPNSRKGLVIIDLGTTAYMKTIGFAKRLKQYGIEFADAPVSGMESRAEAGELSLMYGGSEEIYKKAFAYFEMISNCVVNFGELGSGQLAKLINQLLFDINVAALSEVLALAAKLGLDPEKTIQVVTTGTGKSWAADFFSPRIANGIFTEGYSMENAYKDLISASEISAQMKIPMPILSVATSIYQMALCKGLGNEAKGSMIKVYEEFLGSKFRKAN